MLLDRLLPLADLVQAQDDPIKTCERILNAFKQTRPTRVLSFFPEADLATLCLEEAGILTQDGRFTIDARDRIIELRAVLEMASSAQDTWEPVLTIPPFLRMSFTDKRVLETSAVVRRLVVSAQNSLLIASPFLDTGFKGLIPGIKDLLYRKGECVLITRDLLRTGSEGHNRRTIDKLRRETEMPENLKIVAWEEVGLGIHMKVIISDEERAYVGSANLTWGGMSNHVEVGTLLKGTAVKELAHLMKAVAREIGDIRK